MPEPLQMGTDKKCWQSIAVLAIDQTTMFVSIGHLNALR